jgi:L-asparagine transporter-like permease
VPQKVAAILAMLAFAMCMVVGGLQADNPFVTTVSRSLVAMAGTFVVGLVLGAMGQKMLTENVAQKKVKDLAAKQEGNGR